MSKDNLWIILQKDISKRIPHWKCWVFSDTSLTLVVRQRNSDMITLELSGLQGSWRCTGMQRNAEGCHSCRQRGHETGRFGERSKEKIMQSTSCVDWHVDLATTVLFESRRSTFPSRSRNWMISALSEPSGLNWGNRCHKGDGVSRTGTDGGYFQWVKWLTETKISWAKGRPISSNITLFFGKHSCSFLTQASPSPIAPKHMRDTRADQQMTLIWEAFNKHSRYWCWRFCINLARWHQSHKFGASFQQMTADMQ